MKTIRAREIPESSYRRLLAAGVPPFMAKLMAARGLERPVDIHPALSSLPDPRVVPGVAEAADMLADAIAARTPMAIIADYDADGATACAVVYLVLQELRAQVAYVVPNRFVEGYGLSPAVVMRAHDMGAKLLLTVDNGIASLDGVAKAKMLGL
jgi:single-stranded-DNA-specific exonuclease